MSSMLRNACSNMGPKYTASGIKGSRFLLRNLRREDRPSPAVNHRFNRRQSSRLEPAFAHACAATERLGLVLIEPRLPGKRRQVEPAVVVRWPLQLPQAQGRLRTDCLGMEGAQLLADERVGLDG